MSYGTLKARLSAILRVTPPPPGAIKVYRALLNQDGSDGPPTAIVLQNQLGGDIVWTREEAGVYIGTLTGAFTYLKTSIHLNTGASVNGFQGANWNNVNSIRVQSYTLTSSIGPTYGDGKLSPAGNALEIIVYP